MTDMDERMRTAFHNAFKFSFRDASAQLQEGFLQGWQAKKPSTNESLLRQYIERKGLTKEYEAWVGGDMNGIRLAKTAPKLPDEHSLAVMFHNAYEAAAIGGGWNTQKACKVPFDSLPEANRKTMLATCRYVLEQIAAAPAAPEEV